MLYDINKNISKILLKDYLIISKDDKDIFIPKKIIEKAKKNYNEIGLKLFKTNPEEDLIKMKILNLFQERVWNILMCNKENDKVLEYIKRNNIIITFNDNLVYFSLYDIDLEFEKSRYIKMIKDYGEIVGYREYKKELFEWNWLNASDLVLFYNNLNFNNNLKDRKVLLKYFNKI